MNGSGQNDLSAVRSFGWTNLSLTKFSQFSDSGTVEWRIGKGFGDWYERKGSVRNAIWVEAVELMGILFYFFRKFGTEVSKFFFVSRVSSLEAVGFGSTAMAVDAALLGAWGVLLVLKSYFQVLTLVVGDWKGAVLYSIFAKLANLSSIGTSGKGENHFQSS